jgi:phage-related protein
VLTIPADIILEKNKLYQSGSFIELLEWQISETGATVRIANSNEDIAWQEKIWSKFWFEGGGESDSGGDSAEAVQVKISAVDKVIQGYLETLTNGGIGDTVIYRRVHTDHLELGAVLTASFEILSIDSGPNNEWVIFDLGQENFFLNQFPAHVTSRDVCRYRPTDTNICQYVNSSECSRSFNDCLWLGQEANFGGQPGIPGGIFNITSIREISKAAYLDAKLYKIALTSSFALDAIIGGANRVYLDAIINPGENSVSTSFDALVQQPASKPYPPENLSLDALINEIVESTLNLDVQIQNIGGTKTLSIDALIYGELEISIDSILIRGSTKTVSLDSQINTERTKQLVIDAIVLLTQCSSSLDAKLSKSITKTTSLDALLSGLKRISLDTQLQSVDNTSEFDIDAFLKKTYESQSGIDAKLIGEVQSTTAIDSYLIEVDINYINVYFDAILYGEFVEDTEGSPIQDTDGGYIEEPS